MDTRELEKLIKNVFRVGIVSSVNPAEMTARVVFPDRDYIEGKDLQIGTDGAKDTCMYWVPHIGEQVLCAFCANDNNLTEGYIIKSLYNAVDRPPASSASVRMILFDDGTIVKNDAGAVTINATKSITINAPTVNITGSSGDVVVNGISLVNHTHGGVMPGGGSTGKPQ